MLDLLDEEPSGALTVLELSSYQISDLAAGPELVVFTNLYPEHADWHGSIEAYRADKLRILSLGEVRTAVLPARQPELAAAPTAARRLLYGEPAGWDVSEEGIALARRAAPRSRAISRCPGEHNALNLCGALTALEAIGIRPPAARRRWRAFKDSSTGCRPSPRRIA